MREGSSLATARCSCFVFFVGVQCAIIRYFFAGGGDCEEIG